MQAETCTLSIRWEKCIKSCHGRLDIKWPRDLQTRECFIWVIWNLWCIEYNQFLHDQHFIFIFAYILSNQTQTCYVALPWLILRYAKKNKKKTFTYLSYFLVYVSVYYVLFCVLLHFAHFILCLDQHLGYNLFNLGNNIPDTWHVCYHVTIKHKAQITCKVSVGVLPISFHTDI